MSYLLNTNSPTLEVQDTPETPQINPETTVLGVKNPIIPENPIEVEPSLKTPPIPQNGDNTESAHSYFTTPREDKEEAPPQEEDKTKDEEQQEDETEEEEEVNSFGLSKDECFLIGEFIADTGDMAIPQITAYLNEQKNVSQYEAGAKQIKSIANAWGRFLYEKQIDVTPTQQILIATGIAYALPLAGGIKHRLPQIKKYIKQFFSKEIKKEHKPMVYKNKSFDNKPPVEKEIEEFEEFEEVEQTQTKKCRKDGCIEKFNTGEGHAKGKDSVNYDAFCSRKCMAQHTGGQSKKNSKKSHGKD